jgi:hypothetical protein
VILGRSLAAFAALTLLSVVACSGADGEVDASAAPVATPDSAMLEPTRDPSASADPGAELCLRVDDFAERLAALRAVELRLPNRNALDIELDKLQASYGELEDVDFGEAEERLAGSLRRLGYRIGELELAVEDFRTNSRPRRAAPHVEEDSQKVADELDAFTLLSRC